MKVNMTSLIAGLASLLFFSLISTFLPREHFGTLWMVLIILYALITMMFTVFLQRIKVRKKMSEVKGSILLKTDEKNVMDIAMRDQELIREMGRQSWGLLLHLIILMVLLFTVIPVLHNAIVTNDLATYSERFLRYLLFYGIVWGAMYCLRLLLLPRRMVIPVTRYEVFSTGIRCSNTWIPFPLDQKRYRVTADHKRYFVEIYDSKSGYAHRLYSSDVYKLYTLIEKYGLRSERGSVESR